MASDGSCKKHLLFFILFFVVILVRSVEGLKTSVVTSFSARRSLSSPSSSSQAMELGRQRPGLPAPYRSFESRKHEVPSGPNPVSNR